MAKKIIYQHAFFTSQIMCFDACGFAIHHALTDLSQFKRDKLLPDDAESMIAAEPHSFGLNQLVIEVASEVDWSSEKDQAITAAFQAAAKDVGFDLIEEDETREGEVAPNNRLNIAMNLVTLVLLIALSIALPPSLPLTVSLIAVSFLITAYTSRQYFIHFWRAIQAKQFLNMSTGVSLGWLLGLGHALYHTLSMPAMLGFSTLFMNVGMPVMLITIVNVLDEIQRSVKASTQKMQLRGMKSLFSFSENYMSRVSLDEEEKWMPRPKSHLKSGMMIRIPRGECTPVDGKIVQGCSLIDTSIINGETQKLMGQSELISAGAINLGDEIVIQAEKNAYHSAVNGVLFSANRQPESPTAQPFIRRIFPYFYAALIVSGIILSLLIPGVLGILTVPLALQSLMGILFAICPCTIVIAHQLSRLLVRDRLHQKGIVLRDEAFLDRVDDIQTLVLDKTGTLTSGESEVVSEVGTFSFGLWQRIYLLEKHHGKKHPLAQAICNYFEAKIPEQTSEGGKHQSSPSPPHPLIRPSGTFSPETGRRENQDISSVALDSQHRGLAGCVQNKKIQIGTYDFLKEAGVQDLHAKECIPEAMQSPINQGYTPIYVAEAGRYQGVIFVKHSVASSMVVALKKFKANQVKLIMLSGDTQSAVYAFNQQCGGVFDETHAEKKPEDKVEIVKNLMKSDKPKGVWFVGDGLNDAPCVRIVNEKGGVSCAMHGDDKAAFFTDISLNGSLAYLFPWQDLNQRLKRNTMQNQGLLLYGSVIFLLLLICLPIAGVGMAPVIPLVIMLSTTSMIMFNAYRMRVAVDVALDDSPSLIKGYFASDLPLSLLVAGSALLVCSLLMMTFASGHLFLPAMLFSAAPLIAVSSGFMLASVVMFGGFAGLTLAYLISTRMPSAQTHQLPTTVIDAEKVQSRLLEGRSLPSFFPPSNQTEKDNAHRLDEELNARC